MSISDLVLTSICTGVYWVQLYKEHQHWIFTGSNELGLPQTPGVGQSSLPKDNKTQHPDKLLQVLGSFHLLWTQHTTDEKPSQDRQPGRLTHYHRYAIPQPQSRQRLSLQLIFQGQSRLRSMIAINISSQLAYLYGMSEISSSCMVSMPVKAQHRMNRMPPSAFEELIMKAENL